jgi:hypothetical protein
MLQVKLIVTAMGLICLAMSKTSIRTVNPDLSGFREAILRAVSLKRDNSLTDCFIPNSSVMFTYTTAYTMKFIYLQHESMKVWGLEQCLISRFVVACLDAESFDMCVADGLQCAQVFLPQQLPPSDFRVGAYYYLTFFKHYLIREALSTVNEVFFIDADALLFSNPWTNANQGRDSRGKPINVGSYDMLYQRERGRTLDCAGTPNSGVMYFKNSSRMVTFARRMDSFRDDILKGTVLEQDFIRRAMGINESMMCTLPYEKYMSNCPFLLGWSRFVPLSAPLSELITYHASCISGMNTKLIVLNKVISLVKSSKLRRIPVSELAGMA